MRILDKFLGKVNSESKSQYEEHAVIIHFNYGLESMDEIFSVSDKLKSVIKQNYLGEFDGNEIAIDYSDGFIYMYGPNAESLFKGIKPILEETNFMEGATAKLRFGPPEDGVKEITIEI